VRTYSLYSISCSNYRISYFEGSKEYFFEFLRIVFDLLNCLIINIVFEANNRSSGLMRILTAQPITVAERYVSSS
jgi:hypothetical protein